MIGSLSLGDLVIIKQDKKLSLLDTIGLYNLESITGVRWAYEIPALYVKRESVAIVINPSLVFEKVKLIWDDEPDHPTCKETIVQENWVHVLVSGGQFYVQLHQLEKV